MVQLEPARPDEPEKLVDADELADRLFIASHMDGEMLSHHDPAPPEQRIERLTAARGLPEREAEPDPRSAAVDRLLDQVRRENAPHWGPEAVARFTVDEDEDDERVSRRARRRARGRSR